MAVCDWCNQEMNVADDCDGNEVVEFPDGRYLEPVAYDAEDHQSRCHDCGAARGGRHHPGCDMEQCPACGGQLISCGCLDDGQEAP